MKPILGVLATGSTQRSPLRRALLSILFVLICFAFLQGAQAVIPPPDGGYPEGNTAEGDSALFSLTSGYGNTAIGQAALFFNTTGDQNTAAGGATLLSNTTGDANTANGFSALYANTTGRGNTGTGVGALFNNTIASDNTATGSNALFDNTTGYRNTATGAYALQQNVTGTNNVADGFQALLNNKGSKNVAVGSAAGLFLTTGSGNVCIGDGVFGVAGESNTTRIRNVYASIASGRAVYVNSDKKIGTLVSSRRFKDEIKPMGNASEAILALKPVTFRYKKEIEPNRSIMFGLIAEEVEQVDRDLVTRNDKGEADAVRYEAVNAMLLNEFLKEHCKIEKLESTVAKQEQTAARQETRIAQQQQQIAALTAGLQKVSAQLEASGSLQQKVADNR